MPLHNDRSTSSAAVSGQGTVSAIPASLLQIPSQIKDVKNKKIATDIIEWGWMGSLAIFGRGTILPLADAIQRSRHIFNAALKSFFAGISRLPMAQQHRREDMMVKFGSRMTFRKLKNVDFEGFSYIHFHTICVTLISHKHAWVGGTLHHDISYIVEFCARIATLLKPDAL